MANKSLHTVLEHIRRLRCVADSAQRSDRELLRAFVSYKDEDAFAALVTRHAPLVWGVCRRILGHHQDAEDAFQATFLVLARRATSVRWQSSVCGWLHTVAQRLAVRARQRAEQRRILEQEASRTPPVDSSLRELAAVIDEELRRLPAKYREPLLLHYLEGATAEKAAQQLGLSRSAFYNRLAHARELLRGRLSRQGLSLAAPLLAAALTSESEAASVSLMRTATRAAMGSAPKRVAALAAEALGVTAMMRMKIGLAMGLFFSVAAGGVVMLAPRAPMDAIPLAERAAEQPKREEKTAVRLDLHGDPLPPGAVARLGTLRFRLVSQQASELRFSPDGKTIAVASMIGGPWLFDASSGKQSKFVHPPYSPIWQVAFSPDGTQLLATAQRLNPRPPKDGLQIWDVASGRRTTELELKGILRLGWTSEGQPLAACNEKDAILLHEIATGRKRRFSAKEFTGNFVLHCAVGKKLLAAAGREPAIVHIWDLTSGEERWTFKTDGIFAFHNSLVLSPDERWLASVESDDRADKTSVKLWDLTTGKAKHILASDQQHLTATTFTQDGKVLATIGQQEIRFWDTASGRETGRLKENGQAFSTTTVAFAPDGKTLATMESLCGAIQLWDVATGELKPAPEGHSTNWVQTASFSPDGKRVTTSGGLDGTIHVWDAATGRQLLRFHRPSPNYAEACTFSSDGRTLYSCWTDQLLVSDAATGQELQVLECKNMKMQLSNDLRTAIALRGNLGSGYGMGAPGGRKGAEDEGWIGGWDVASRKQIFRRRLAYQGIGRDLAISPDGKIIAMPSVKQKSMYLEDVETGERLLTFPALKGRTSLLAFSTDGRLLLSATNGSERRLQLWELLTATELVAFPISKYFSETASLSPDGRLLAMIPPQEDTVPSREEILLWDIKRGKELHRFKGYDSSVTSLAFSPDSRSVVSGLYNSSLLVWDVPQPEPVATGKIGAESMSKAWDELAGSDAPHAFRARWTLTSAPGDAIPFLKEHLHPAKSADPKRLRDLLSALEGEQFAAREKAQDELAKLGELAEPALRQTLANKPSLEMRRRVQALLERLHGPVTQPELLQSLRAVAVLEDIGTPGARRLLEELAKGAPESRLTRDAKASLKRMVRK